MITLNSRGRYFGSEKPLIMAVLNCSHDSFYEASRSTHYPEILTRIDAMIDAGADIIDIGGKSTRPGSLEISAEEEIERIAHAVEYLAGHPSGIWGSIDTTNSTVARYAIENGLHIVNDISGGEMDEHMVPTVAMLGVPFVCTHMQGTPQTMQENPQYTDVTEEILSFFTDKISQCAKAGIHDIILDPGFGFGKTLDHNYRLVRGLDKIVSMGYPVLTGFSRKSMVYKLLEGSPEGALNGTTVLNTIALLKGASMLRVHDVREARETIKIVGKFQEV